jgi:hypothetical protein
MNVKIIEELEILNQAIKMLKEFLIQAEIMTWPRSRGESESDSPQGPNEY